MDLVSSWNHPSCVPDKMILRRSSLINWDLLYRILVWILMDLVICYGVWIHMGFIWDVVHVQLCEFSELWIYSCVDFQVCGVVVYMDCGFVCLCVPVMLFLSFVAHSFELFWTPIMLIFPQRRLDLRRIAVDPHLDFASCLRGFGFEVTLWYVLGFPSYGFGVKLYLVWCGFVENWIWININWAYVDLSVHVVTWILCPVDIPVILMWILSWNLLFTTNKL